jgi:hypothetical protein
MESGIRIKLDLNFGHAEAKTTTRRIKVTERITENSLKM